MQTVSQPSDLVQERRKPRERMRFRTDGNAPLVIVTLIVFAAYISLAAQLQGIDFDTSFLAIYCTFLTVFIIKCFASILLPGGKY